MFRPDHFAGLACHQSLDISGVLLHDDLGGLLDEGDELVVLGDEVGLGVDLDDDAHLALGAVISVDHALGSHAACLLGGGSQTTLTQDLDRLLEVAVSLGQSLLALHHAAVGLLAQFHNVLCRNSHFCYSPLHVICLVVRWEIRRLLHPQRERPPGCPACLPAQRQP